MAYEAHKSAFDKNGGKIDGVIYEEYVHNTITAYKIEILNEKGEKATGKRCGKYITARLDNSFTPSAVKENSEFIARQISEMLPTQIENVLIAGLGNRFITADSIGPKTIPHIIVTRHIRSSFPSVCESLSLCNVAAIAPGVLAQTGIESGEMIKSIIDDISPSCLIVIDSLATQKFSHLSCMIQISSCGIQPGSGVHNSRLEITKESMGIPVISVGVPTVIDISSLTTDISERFGISESHNPHTDHALECFITLKETDLITDNMAKLIAYSLNLALHKALSYEEMISLCS